MAYIKDPEMQLRRNYIPDGGMNDVIKNWHDKQPSRVQTTASPSTLTQCAREVWRRKHGVPFTNDMGWGTKQRLMLGRIAENLFAEQLKDQDKLLWHWKDDVKGESEPFELGEGLTKMKGIPDLLISMDKKVLISDSKTSRADSFAYVPMDESIWEDELWNKYRLQVEAYYLLCHKNPEWFKQNKLPLPEECHLFSYALDDGVVKRELRWKPTIEIAEEIMEYVVHWNEAYASETEPDCDCTESQVKFCPYATEFMFTRTGYKLGTECCGEG